MNKKIFFVFCVVLIGVLIFHFFFRPPSPMKQKEKEWVKLVLPKADDISAKDSRKFYYGYKIANNRKIPIGIVFNTYDVNHQVYGYVDKINLLVGIDNKGVIQGVRLLSHQETPGYFKKVEKSDILKQFIGKRLIKPLITEKDVDTVTGATVSSTAIIETINKAGAHYVTDVLKIKGVNFPKEKKQKEWLVILKKEKYALITLGGLIIFGFIAYLSKKRSLWLIEAALAAYLLGFHWQSFLSILHIMGALLVSPQILLRSFVTMGLLGVFVIIGLVIPRFFCGYICPFGGLMRLIYAATLRDLPLPKFFQQVKYFILIAIIAVFGITLYQNFVDIEPFIILFNYSFSLSNIIYILFFVVLAFFFAHFWCNNFCPLGALGGMLAKVSILRKKVLQDCGKCGKCVKVCPHHAFSFKEDKSISYDPAECFSCQECIRQCPKNAITL